jgi:hypothetical protein
MKCIFNCIIRRTNVSVRLSARFTESARKYPYFLWAISTLLEMYGARKIL